MPRLTVAHDYICPWCYIGWFQSLRLKKEFPALTFEWKGFELLPEGLPYTPKPPDPDADLKPRTPSRLELLEAADGIKVPARSGPLSNSRLALEGAEFAAAQSKADAYHDAVYRAYWRDDRDISDKAVLTEIAESVGLDIGKFLEALEKRTFRNAIVEYDEPAHQAGVWNVPTWMFPEAWVAEQPYSLLRDLAARFVREPENQDDAPQVSISPE